MLINRNKLILYLANSLVNSSQSYKRKSYDFQRLLSSSVASTLLLCSVCPALFWVGRPDGATWPWMVGSPSQIAPAPLPTRLRNFPSTLRVLPSSLNQPGIPQTLDVPSERGPAGARSPWVLSLLCLGPTHHQAALASVLTPCLAPPARRVPLPNQTPGGSHSGHLPSALAGAQPLVQEGGSPLT